MTYTTIFFLITFTLVLLFLYIRYLFLKAIFVRTISEINNAISSELVMTDYPVFAENIPLYTVIQEASLSARDHIIPKYMKVPEYNLVVRSYYNIVRLNGLFIIITAFALMIVVILS